MKRKAGSFTRVSAKGYAYEEIVVADDLKRRIGRGGGIPPQASQAADRAIEKLTGEFVIWGKRDIDRLIGLGAELQGALVDHEREEIRHNIRIIAHELRGQGATFGYPLITEIATCLGAIMRIDNLDRGAQIALVRNLGAMMHQVFDERLTGAGGASGAQMLKEARSLAERASAAGRGA